MEPFHTTMSALQAHFFALHANITAKLRILFPVLCTPCAEAVLRPCKNRYKYVGPIFLLESMSQPSPAEPPSQSGSERIFADGQLARLIRSRDWSQSPLGPIAHWPDALVITLNTVLANQAPSFLYWGEQFTQFYNDAAIPIVGPDKHPSDLGRPAQEAWSEIWSLTGPQLRDAMQGVSTWNEDCFAPIYRGGRLQDAWFTFSYSPVRDAGGRVCGALCTVLETTPRVLTQRALSSERERLLALLDQAPAFLAVLRGPEFVCEMANRAYLRLVGDRSILGKKLREALPEIAEQGYIDILERVFRSGEPFIGQNPSFSLELPEGGLPQTHYADFVYQPLRDPDGSVSSILVFGVDITSRQRDEKLVREQRDRFDFATDAGQIGYWFCDLPFDKFIWDKRTKEHFFLPPDAEVNVRLFYRLIHPDDREPTRRAIEQSIENHTRYDVEYRTLGPNGACKWIRATGRTAYAPDGTPLRFDGITQEITALKQAQAARDRAEAALIRSEKLALVGRLAATISHEINNPLESVTNLLFLIRNSTPDETSRAYAHLAEEELARVSHIVTHTLRFNRQAHNPSWEKLSDILESSVAIYQPRLSHSDISLVRDFADVQPILCFPSELRQVFANLIGNAFDASRAGGRLILRTRPQSHPRTGNPGIRVTIADTGHGMDGDTRRRLFEPFFTTKESNGTGLGLWVSREILQKHQGLIRVKSRRKPLPSGTVFCIWLPLSPTGQAGPAAE